MKVLLSNTGLSMSQAQSISNICYQRTLEIDNKIAMVNNYSRTIKIDGEELVETNGISLPTNIVDMVLNKGTLSALQGYLMEGIKAKDDVLAILKRKQFDTEAWTKENPRPIRKEIDRPILLEEVSEEWGWEQLTFAETAEFLEVEAKASHIGQFIHKNGKLSVLRREMPNIKPLEWMSIKDGEKTPLKVHIHHTSEQLMQLHETLAVKHREFETRVNYFKAKVKNLTTLENARINEENANLLAAFSTEYNKATEVYNSEYTIWRANLDKTIQIFEADKAREIKETAALRLSVDPRFQSLIDEILSSIKVADKE